MIALHFSGFFQCRLATDPDPSDEPRGVTGFMWAAAGEPDFDRIIRFHDPVALRSYAPEVGVFVTSVTQDGRPVPDHSLMGAKVELLDEPRFEGRNGIVAASSTEPILPFKIQIAGGGVSIMRDSGITEETFGPGGYGSYGTMTVSPRVISAATGVWNVNAMRRDRAAALAADLAAATTDTERAALTTRLENLKYTLYMAESLFVTRLNYSFMLPGRNRATVIHDDQHRISPALDTERSWPIEFWLGGWDSDSMTGFADGWLTLPQIAASGVEEPKVRAGLGIVQPLEYADLADPDPQAERINPADPASPPKT